MERLKLTGVVLRTVDYGESDRVVTLFTEQRGKISAFARGARASRRRFGGALQPFTLLSVEAHARRPSDLVTLDSTLVIRGFGGIRADLTRIACAGYACELARELVRDAEPHPDLLAVLLDYLGRLDVGPAQPGTLRAFELVALQAAGLMPRLSGCARCGSLVGHERGPSAAHDDGDSVIFDPAEGGVVCAGCAPRNSPAASRLSGAAVQAMVRLQAGGLAAPEAGGLAPRIGAELRNALSRFIEHHLGHRLASRKFLDEVGPLLGT